jgi:hypothetical protein
MSVIVWQMPLSTQSGRDSDLPGDRQAILTTA